MTLFEIKATVAAMLSHSTEDLVVNSVDLGLIAMNQVRVNAELNHNFEFTRKTLTLPVSSVVGGSLDDAVIFGTEDKVQVKGIVDVGLFDSLGNLRAVEWTTVAESLNRQRMENPFQVIRYPTDAQAESSVGQSRFIFSGNQVMFTPRPTSAVTFNLGIEAYTFTPDWTQENLIDETFSDPWTFLGHQYIIWQSVIQVNHLYKEFVFRQEGNLPPPKELADTGLANFMSWDTFKYEQSRRHGR